MKLSRRAAAVGTAVVLSLSLAACGGQDMEGMEMGEPAATGGATAAAPQTPAPSSSTGAVSEVHNAADVEFSQGMVVHHRGALGMAEMAIDQAGSEEVRSLAEKIAADQEPEIATMSSWLQAWGEPVPEGMSMEGMSMEGMDHAGMGSMPGMMSEESMAQLGSAQGAEFDRMFLEMMVEHHRGAVEMSQTEQAEGRNPEAIALAEQIQASQTQEIEQMEQLLQTL